LTTTFFPCETGFVFQAAMQHVIYRLGQRGENRCLFGTGGVPGRCSPQKSRRFCLQTMRSAYLIHSLLTDGDVILEQPLPWTSPPLRRWSVYIIRPLLKLDSPMAICIRRHGADSRIPGLCDWSSDLDWFQRPPASCKRTIMVARQALKKHVHTRPPARGRGGD